MPTDFIRREPLHRMLDLLDEARGVEHSGEQRLLLARGLEQIAGAAMAVIAVASRRARGWEFEQLISPQAQQATVRRMLAALAERGLGFNPALRAAGLKLRGGRTTTLRRRDLVADAEWYQSEYFADFRRAAGLDDAVYAMRSLGPGRVFGVGVHRGLRERPFSEEERNLIHVFHDEVSRMEGRRAEPDEHPRLTPRQRDVLRWLLSGVSEKQVAAELGISQQTVHAHVKGIYVLYGVSSRPELLVRCLRGRR